MGYPVLAVLCAALVLTGCAGGDRPAVMPDPDRPPESEDHERRDRLAAGYRAHPAFGRQWGLERIGADLAHARLAIQHGEDVRPGTRVLATVRKCAYLLQSLVLSRSVAGMVPRYVLMTGLIAAPARSLGRWS